MEQTRSGTRSLTRRQREVLGLIAKGHRNAEIGDALGIRVDGAKWHVRELLIKFDAESREELVERWAAENTVRARFAALGSALTGMPHWKPAIIVGSTATAVAGIAVGFAALDRGGPSPAAEDFQYDWQFGMVDRMDCCSRLT